MIPQSTPQSRAAEVMERLKAWLLDLDDQFICARVQCDASEQRHIKEDIDTLTAAIALIEQGEKERERLDWLDKHRNWWAPRRHVDGYEQISRAAIDAAIDAAREQPTPESK
jgi:hypothetical protein